MKIKVNRNILWAKTFSAALVNAGLEYVCISPGSRSTPLTYAFAVNRKIKSHVVVDERSSGFFALGLAKETNKPVVIVCTSGTAVAELYPAIIEAYQSKVPLIVCTADRPPEVLNTGANQTINQRNIYKNHIRWFIDAGLPQISESGLIKIIDIAQKAIIESSVNHFGPVHINFPFREPFEPSSFTDEVNTGLIKTLRSKTKLVSKQNSFAPKIDKKILSMISDRINRCSKGIIVVGLDNYSKNFFAVCSQLSNRIGYPILADAASNMRFAFNANHNILTSYDSYLRSESFVKKHQPDFIIQFGRNFSSKALSNYIAGNKRDKLLVNQFGDWKSPKTTVLACHPELFCRELISLCKNRSLEWNEWLYEFSSIEKAAKKIKISQFTKASFSNETKIVSDAVNSIPDGSNLMLSNSLPIRDLDLIVALKKKNIKVFHNRGASGIDGIISTALGIAQSSKNQTYLITGDLAFYYDLNSLQLANKYSIPLTIILINNNGGRIFEVLPISSHKNIFEEYFAVPHNLNFQKLVSAFGGIYRKVKGWKEFQELLNAKYKSNTFRVLEIKTDPAKSLALRRKYYDKVISAYNHNSKKLL